MRDRLMCGPVCLFAGIFITVTTIVGCSGGENLSPGPDCDADPLPPECQDGGNDSGSILECHDDELLIEIGGMDQCICPYPTLRDSSGSCCDPSVTDCDASCDDSPCEQPSHTTCRELDGEASCFCDPELAWGTIGEQSLCCDPDGGCSTVIYSCASTDCENGECLVGINGKRCLCGPGFSEISPNPGEPHCSCDSGAQTDGECCAELVLTGGALPAGEVGRGYESTLKATGGFAPLTFSITSGALPDGLTLDESLGTIAGTPKAEGSFEFDITATDSCDPGQSATETFSIEIDSGIPEEVTLTVDVTAGLCTGTVIAHPADSLDIDCPDGCDATVPYGTEVSLLADPDPGCTIHHWAGCDTVDHDLCTVTVVENMTVEAYFETRSDEGEVELVTDSPTEVEVLDSVVVWAGEWTGADGGMYVPFTCLHDHVTSIEWVVYDARSNTVSYAPGPNYGDPYIPCVDPSEAPIRFGFTVGWFGSFRVEVTIIDEFDGTFTGSFTVTAD